MPQNNSSDTLADLIGQLALSKNAENVICINVKNITSMTDQFVICSADTDIQVKAIAETIRRGTPHKPVHTEGMAYAGWVLLDYIDVVVHILRTQEREYYNLEKLWADAPSKEIIDESENSTSSSTA